MCTPGGLSFLFSHVKFLLNILSLAFEMDKFTVKANPVPFSFSQAATPVIFSIQSPLLEPESSDGKAPLCSDHINIHLQYLLVDYWPSVNKLFIA